MRTPKGLGWLKAQISTTDQNLTLKKMVELRNLHCAVWSECIWLIADASKSATQFIVSDHPVTVYNRRCGPKSEWCRGSSDPPIWFHATHTIFPLSLDTVLILTNGSWARNPYQSEIAARPNFFPWRESISGIMDIQILRSLSEQEVLEINFIIKSRALRYVAAAREEWLYPEKHVSKSDWHEYGNGYLLMPEPRDLGLEGITALGFKDGRSMAFDAYGRRSGQRDFQREYDTMSEWNSLQRFQKEFASLNGPFRRGRTFFGGRLAPERYSDDYHQSLLDSDQ